METPPEITPLEAKLLLADPSYVWIDVREHMEWNVGHLTNARHMPMSTLTEQSFDAFSKDQHMIIVCRSGNRSHSVTHALRELGFVNAQNLSGGMFGMNTVLEKPIPVF